jgi:D-sedoheptulose 7-phosphate isomerase
MNWEKTAGECRAVADEVLGPMRAEVERVAAAIAGRLAAGGKALFCGNGGSAADAQHMAGEFVNRFLRERRPYAGLALSTDTSVLTAIANDYAYEEVFEKQVRALGRPGDVLVAFSTSGNAASVCRALQAARAAGILTVGLTGGAGGRMRALCDLCLCIASTAHTPRVQEGHQLLMHLLCERIEEILE